MQSIRNAAGKLIHRADGKSYCIEIARKRVRALPRVPGRIGAGAGVRPPQAAAGVLALTPRPTSPGAAARGSAGRRRTRRR